jgi:hypothetical protein
MATRQLLITIREADGSLTQNRDWSNGDEFDVAQARRFSRWQRAVERGGRKIMEVALAGASA